MEPYLAIHDSNDLEEFARTAARLRLDDITDFTNLPNVFISGRKVEKVPNNSSDVTPEDRVGDFNTTGAYLYVLVDSGGAVWRRVALSSW